MATLILTTLGGAVGGPIGAALGAVIGQTADRVLLAPKGRQGPRLTELAVQTSSYGMPIPRAYGVMRLAGSVIWATDLQESSQRSGGKGQPSTTTYSYSASFAVALSARPIRSVRRIWADGKLLRGAAGDLKSEGRWRLHLGDEGQQPDPLIAEREGVALTPAHRGMAYAVFEDLQLADFGNRIPSLTFEVVADEAPVSVAEIAREMSGGTIDGNEATLALGGFAASGDSVRGVAELLAGATGGWFAPRPGGVTLRAGLPAAVPLTARRTETEHNDPAMRRTAPLDTVPRSLSLACYDPSRDYQTGVQRVRRPGAGRRDERLDLPAVLPAGDAKAVAETVLRAAVVRRRTRRLVVGPEGLRFPPGTVVTLPDEAGTWRVARCELTGMTVALDLVPLVSASLPRGASAGRPVPAPDHEAGATVLVAAELPVAGDLLAETPRLTVLATGTGAGWRGAALLHSLDNGASWSPAGRTAAPAVLGTLTAPLTGGTATLIDQVAAIEVRLDGPGAVLFAADREALDAGANLALVGDELLQFARAAPLGGERWRLSGLLRGRGGTEGAIGQADAGARFALLDPDTLATIALPASAIGGTVRVMAVGLNDPQGTEIPVLIDGASVRPPSPVKPVFTETADGGGTLRWTRRSRAGWAWIDGSDVPLAEESQRYRVRVTSAAAAPREQVVTDPVIGIADVERPANVEIRQIGRNGDSPPLIASVPAV